MAGSTFLRTLLLINLALFSTAAILPRVPQGQQFITGACVTDSDCASDCCAFTTGKCAGAVIAQQRDGGCGFGDGVPNNRAAQVIQGPNALAAPGVIAGAAAPAPVAAAPAPAAAPAALGTQFITGDCATDSACASGCCNARTGKCAARLVAQENNSAAGGCGRGSGAPVAAAPAAAAPAPAVVGTQFITGDCASDSACASGCCNARTGKCAARLVAEEFGSRAGGCGFNGTPIARRTVVRSVVAKRQGQFITGDCASDSACASGCCNARTGKCAARLVAEEFNSRAGGCGFGGIGAPVAAPVAAAPAPAAVGTQFITGPCTSDSNCASGCCGFTTGKCAGAIIALERDGGCGFGNAVSNGDAAARLRAGLRR